MFKGYDVRGVYGKEINEGKFRLLGRALAQFDKEIILGTDYRPHNDSLAAAFETGFASACGGECKKGNAGKIVFLGNAPTPAIAFCTKKLGASLTASHNPPEYVGLKPFRCKRCFYGEELGQLKAYYAQEEESEKAGEKTGETARTANEAEKSAAAAAAKTKTKPTMRKSAAELKEYTESIPEISAKSKTLFDLGGGAACAVRGLFPKTIFGEPDPIFSKRDPEPKDETLATLKAETLKAGALGFAFDGDADRVVAVDKGKTIDSGTLGAFYASRFLKKGDVVALTIDVSEEICDWFSNNGFQLAFSAVGDINVTRKADEARAAFSMERSGHFAVTKHMLYSDGIYVAAALSGTKPGELTEFAAQFKCHALTQKIPGRINFRDLEKLFRAKNPAALETVDGIKAKFDDYCVLVRASQTEPVIRVNVEAQESEKAKKGFEATMALVKKTLTENATQNANQNATA